jgi:undecaprenyl-diphosphatase
VDLEARPQVGNSFERRGESRGLQRVMWDVFYAELRASRVRALGIARTLGIFLLGGTIVAVLGTLVFAGLASHVRAGSTQAFDDAILRWFGAHHVAWLDAAMVEITLLGTATVVLMVAGVAALFLYLTNHRYSALLLVIATAGGVLLNAVLKFGFSRPRPQIFAWGTDAFTSSFPSGHAMSATIIYGTVAYLAARLQPRRWARWTTLIVAAIAILLICTSRVYLGVHYPSDILAGIVVGLAWAGFCMATLEAIQRIEMRHAPPLMRMEEPAPKDVEKALKDAATG